jgi:hypothetical protein
MMEATAMVSIRHTLTGQRERPGSPAARELQAESEEIVSASKNVFFSLYGCGTLPFNPNDASAPDYSVLFSSETLLDAGGVTAEAETTLSALLMPRTNYRGFDGADAASLFSLLSRELGLDVESFLVLSKQKG